MMYGMMMCNYWSKQHQLLPHSTKPFLFLDTPGHYHFDLMRENTAIVADAVLLMVAANEGLVSIFPVVL